MGWIFRDGVWGLGLPVIVCRLMGGIRLGSGAWRHSLLAEGIIIQMKQWVLVPWYPLGIGSRTIHGCYTLRCSPPLYKWQHLHITYTILLYRHIFPYIYIFFFFWGRTKVWLQGLRFARQVLYHLTHSASPFPKIFNLCLAESIDV
jgi:hypothetical protein